MADFIGEDLTGAHFERTTLNDATFTAVELRRVRMRGVELDNLKIDGYVNNVVINGVDIVPLISAELDRRHPDRPKMRPTDPAGFREAWTILEHLWAGTVDRARTFKPDQLHESVDGEWSFIETLRHLSFATDSWVRRAIQGDPSPWHPLGLPWDEMPDTPGVPRDRTARPTLDEILAVRHDRATTVRHLVDSVTDETLAAHTTPVDAPGWPQPRSYPVRECLLIVLNEEWEHRLYAERDLNALEESRE